MIDSVRQLVWIARVESVSLLVLLAIAMPLKYGADMPGAVSLAGSAHGFAFFAFGVALVRAARDARWPASTIARAVAASLVPLGAFWFERWCGINAPTKTRSPLQDPGGHHGRAQGHEDPR